VRVMCWTELGASFVLAARLRVACGKIIRVQVASKRLGMDTEQFLIVPDSLFKRIERFLVFKVSDEVADKGVAVPCQAKRILKLRACTQNWFLCPRNLHLTRRVAPRTAHKVRLPAQRCYHGIIHTHMDRAVVPSGRRPREEPSL
jgi:hypothetical protein